MNVQYIHKLELVMENLVLVVVVTVQQEVQVYQIL